jgi:hypothetical protein
MIEIWGGFRMLDEFSKALMPGKQSFTSHTNEHIGKNLDEMGRRPYSPRTGAQQLLVDNQQKGRE